MRGSPVKCSCEDEVVVGADLVETALMKGPVVDQAARLVDND